MSDNNGDTPSRRSTRSSTSNRSTGGGDNDGGGGVAPSPAVSNTSRHSRSSGVSNNGNGNGGAVLTSPTGSNTSRHSRSSAVSNNGNRVVTSPAVSSTSRQSRSSAATNGNQVLPSPSVSISSRSSAGANNAGRRRVNVRGDHGAGGVAPFSPAVSSLGLASPASRRSNMASPRGRGGAAGSDLLNSPLNYGTPTSISTPRTSAVQTATPLRVRNDINADRNRVQINVPQAEGEDAPQLLIWGTNVSSTEYKTKFARFIQEFKETNLEEDDFEMVQEMVSDRPFYMRKLEEMKLLEEPFLNLNCVHLQKFDEDLYRQLINYPQEVIPTMDTTVNEIFFTLYPDVVLRHQIEIRPFNADKTKTMRLLDPEEIDQLVTISGMVIRTSNIMPEMREGYFKCSVCDNGAKSGIDRGKFTEPVLCDQCNTNFSFTLIHNRSQFVDKQLIRLQEDLEDTPVGETPYMANLFAHNEMVNMVQPGDRITVTGIYRAAPFRINPRMRTVRAVYKTFIDVVHFRKVDTKRLRDDRDGKGLHISQERIEFIQELSKKEDIYERLAKAIAPSIYEHDDIKKGILLQLFGGTTKEFENTGRGRFRAEVNILLCGDPGTSKSQLLKYVYDLVPRSQYTSGKGSSAVGLTAYVTKDPETKQLVLQTGALVLADNGVCCIDEFDKMSESTRSILHEVMEQQTLSIAKAGIICQLNARTSILAAANPIESQWNLKKTIIENVNLPHTLLSRFDLIFLMLDEQQETYDKRLARHMISLYFKDQDEEDLDLIEMSVLRDYIAYAKEFIQPKLSDDASQRLIQIYVDMRKAGSGTGRITAYPRQLEALIRLSEAHAKIRLSEKVEIVDVEEAWRLHREAMKAAATDPLTGKIDMSIMGTGISDQKRKRMKDLCNVIKRHLEAGGKGSMNYQKLLGEIKEKSQVMVSRDDFEDALKELGEQGDVIVQGKTTVRLCRVP